MEYTIKKSEQQIVLLRFFNRNIGKSKKLKPNIYLCIASQGKLVLMIIFSAL